jgi:hypothetical protein
MNITMVRIADVIDPAPGRALLVTVEQDNGVPHTFSLPVPVEWDAWDRAQKVAWVKAQAETLFAGMTFYDGATVVYPNRAARVLAKAGVRGLPGWATWTAAEADAWINTNVTDLASAKLALRRMAQMLCHLRDIVVER